MKSHRRHFGFTLVEMMLTLTIIALVATLAIPKLAADSGIRIMSIARLLRSDIELAQVMTIGHPEDPVSVIFDTDNGIYWLAYESDPVTPLADPVSGEPYLIEFGIGRAAVATDMTIAIVDIPGDELRFNAQGGLRDFSYNPVITLAHGDRWATLAISPTTGAITETNGDGTPP